MSSRILLVCVLISCGVQPAYAEEALRLLVSGYSASLIGTEWAYAGEEHYDALPQTDGAGGVYRIAGGTPGRTILRAATGRVTEFAEVAGPGDPRLLGLWFDDTNAMIVVVRRLVDIGPRAPGETRSLLRLTNGGAERAYEHGYYRIRGFPPRRYVMRGFGRSWTGAVLLLSLSASLALMVRQVHELASRLRRRV